MAEKTDKELLDLMVVNGERLLAACNVAATNLSDEFQDLITGPADDFRAIISMCDKPDTAWDGEMLDEDLEIEQFRSDYQRSNEEPRGAKITHKITGLSNISYGKPTYPENVEVAKRSLRERVRKEYESRS